VNTNIDEGIVTLYLTSKGSFEHIKDLCRSNQIEYTEKVTKEDYILSLSEKNYLIWGLDYECKDLQ
jgi:hypothetical protein